MAEERAVSSSAVQSQITCAVCCMFALVCVGIFSFLLVQWTKEVLGWTGLVSAQKEVLAELGEFYTTKHFNNLGHFFLVKKTCRDHIQCLSSFKSLFLTLKPCTTPH